MTQLYDSQTWTDWQEEETKNYRRDKKNPDRKIYEKRGYLHFDPRCWFPDRSAEIKRIVSDPKQFDAWSFFPFLKVINETPRFKYNAEYGRPLRSIKERPICYAAHKDALIYSFCSYSLTKRYEAYIHENGFADAVLAYRSDLNGDCNIQFAKQVFDYIREVGECTVIALDIKSFFDNLDHRSLKDKWAKVIGESRLPAEHFKLYKTLTQFACANLDELLDYLNIDLKKVDRLPKAILDLFPTKQHAGLFRQLRERNIIKVQKDRGIPQGSPMSAVLSNIYMIDFDARLHQFAKVKGLLYRRYCDDILIVCPQSMVVEAKQIAYETIEDCALIIQPEKEEEISFRFDGIGKLRAFDAKEIVKRPHKFIAGREHYFYKSLQYLGFEFNGQDALIRNASLCRYHKKLKRRINKSVKMAYSDSSLSDKVFTQTTYRRYSHLGYRNFITYVYRCAAINYTNSDGNTKPGMASPKIRSQVARHMRSIQKALIHKNQKRFEYKQSQDSSVNLKRI